MPDRARPYRLSPRAEADLEDIWLYTFKHWSLAQADSYFADFIAAFEGLSAGSRTGRPVDIRNGYFKYPVGAHVVFYRPSTESLNIVRVLHRRMDVGRHL